MRRWAVPMAFVTSVWAVVMVHALVCPSSEATGMTNLQYIGIGGSGNPKILEDL